MDANRKRIALYRNSKYNFETTRIVDDGEEDDVSNFVDYIRISKVAYVDFKLLDKGEIIAQEVKALDAVLDELMSKIESVRAKKSELLSITHEVES